MRWRATFAGLLTAAAAVLAGGAGGAQAAQRPTNCFWLGPISTRLADSPPGFHGRYFNFPEESAVYWLARYRLPAGSRLTLEGRFPHARYESFNGYAGGAPIDVLTDTAIRPAPGATNPFVAGNRRDSPKRSYRVTVRNRTPPGAARPANSLYVGPRGDAPSEIVYRVYEPDRGRDLSGDVGVPRPVVRLAGGGTLEGEAACEAINDANRAITVQSIARGAWLAVIGSVGCDPAVAPAFDPPRWERFFNLGHVSSIFLECTPEGAAQRLRNEPVPPDAGGFYSNADTRYIFTFLSGRFGPVAVIRGRMPTFPDTYRGARRMPGGHLRFWSLCSGESRVTTRTPDCLADRHVPLGPGRRYTIVASRPADRPANAIRRCGYRWIDLGRRGDGAGRTDAGFLIMRNMAPSPSFRQAIQRIERPDRESEVMGPYLPTTRYTTTAEFEARGCG